MRYSETVTERSRGRDRRKKKKGEREERADIEFIGNIDIA